MLRDYFIFSRRERRAVIILTGIILLLAFAPVFFPAGSLTNSSRGDSLMKEIAQLFHQPDSTAHNSMINEMYDEAIVRDITAEKARISHVRDTVKENSAQRLTERIDINSVGAKELAEQTGIGIRLAERVIKFRDRLGGFYDIEQVAETYELNEGMFELMKGKLMILAPWKLIDINNASADEMRAHPYIRYRLAQAIVNYREEHGSFDDVEAIRKIELVTPEIYTKLAPYFKTH